MNWASVLGRVAISIAWVAAFANAQPRCAFGKAVRAGLHALLLLASIVAAVHVWQLHHPARLQVRVGDSQYRVGRNYANVAWRPLSHVDSLVLEFREIAGWIAARLFLVDLLDGTLLKLNTSYFPIVEGSTREVLESVHREIGTIINRKYVIREG